MGNILQLLSLFVAYKRLLARHNISINTGNVMPIDNIKMLNVSLTKSRKKRTNINRYNLTIYNIIQKSLVAEKYRFIDHPKENYNLDEISEFLNFA